MRCPQIEGNSMVKWTFNVPILLTTCVWITLRFNYHGKEGQGPRRGTCSPYEDNVQQDSHRRALGHVTCGPCRSPEHDHSNLSLVFTFRSCDNVHDMIHGDEAPPRLVGSPLIPFESFIHCREMPLTKMLKLIAINIFHRLVVAGDCVKSRE